MKNDKQFNALSLNYFIIFFFSLSILIIFIFSYIQDPAQHNFIFRSTFPVSHLFIVYSLEKLVSNEIIILILYPFFISFIFFAWSCLYDKIKFLFFGFIETTLISILFLSNIYYFYERLKSYEITNILHFSILVFSNISLFLICMLFLYRFFQNKSHNDLFFARFFLFSWYAGFAFPWLINPL